MSRKRKQRRGPKQDGALENWPSMPVDLWSYDIDSKVWQCVLPRSATGVYPAAAPATRWLHSAVPIGNRMIVFGGVTESQQVVGDLWIFDPEAQTWLEANPKGTLPLPREGHCAAYTPTTMLVFGGVSYGYQPFNDVWSYSTVTNTWEELSPNQPFKAPVPRWMTSCAAVQAAMDAPAQLYVFGGVSQEYVPLNDLMKFDTESKTWSKVEAAAGFAPFPRMMHNMVWMGTRLYIFGGVANNIPFEDLAYYDMASNSWAEVFPYGAFPFARAGASVAKLNPPAVPQPARPLYTDLKPDPPNPRPDPRYRKTWTRNQFAIVFGGAGSVRP